MTSNNFCIQCKQSVNNYLEDLWSEIAVSFILQNLRTIKYRLQLTGKASIPEYMYVYIYTEGAKSQYPYVGLNSSVTECPIEIILSGMTYYHHWFEEFVKSKHICVHFFQMKVHFRIYLIVWIVGSSQILLDCVWPFELRFY